MMVYRNVVIKASPQDSGVWLHPLHRSGQTARTVRDTLKMCLWWRHGPDLAHLMYDGLASVGLGPAISSRSQRRAGEGPDIVLTARCEGLPHGRVRIGHKTWSFPQFRDLTDAEVEVL